MTAAGTPALEVRDLVVTYQARRGAPAVRAVDHVNLCVGKGEIVALIGESGCGKSTLARAMVGLVRPTSGEVCYDGTALSYAARDLKAYRRHTQLVLQDPAGALNPRHNVYDAVAEGPRLHGLKGDLDPHGPLRPVAGRSAPTRGVRGTLSPRAVGRTTATGRHRRCARARPARTTPV